MSDLMLRKEKVWARRPQLYLTKRIKRRIEVREMKADRQNGSGNNHHTDHDKEIMLKAIIAYRQAKSKAKNRARRKVTSIQRQQQRG
jgi:hypothetical protein